MPRNGSGTYALPPIYLASPGSTILAQQHNDPFADVAAALTGSLAADGQTPMTGNLQMNGRKITGLAVGTNPTDAVRLDQVSDPTSITLAQMKLFGLSVVGNAPLIANVDDTAIGSGTYRFDNTTSGAFPTGVAAADTGLVTYLRLSTTAAAEVLYHASSNRIFHRRMAAGVWQTWQRIMAGAQNLALDFIVTAALGIAANKNDTTIPTSAAVAGYVDPLTPAVEANFSAISLTGTYSRTGNTVTVTMAAHGMATGHWVTLDFTTGTATDGWYQITVIDANTFTVTDTASGTTSGNVTRQIWARRARGVSSIVDTGTGDHSVNYAAAADAGYTVLTTVANGLSDNWTASPVARTTTSVQVLVRNGTNTPSDASFVNVVVFR